MGGFPFSLALVNERQGLDLIPQIGSTNTSFVPPREPAKPLIPQTAPTYNPRGENCHDNF